MPEHVLVIAAHPDDEVLGCGGTMAGLADAGAVVRAAFLADGVAARDHADESDLASRRDAACRASARLGAQEPWLGSFADNRLDARPRLDLIKVVEGLIRDHQPEMVLTHHAGDLNIDHRRTHEAVVTACRPQRGHPVRTLLFFEVPSSTEWQPPGSGIAFQPSWFVDISRHLDQKLQALEAYAEELRDWPHPRSREGVRHLAHWRGACVGHDAAEAFMLGRHIQCVS